MPLPRRILRQVDVRVHARAEMPKKGRLAHLQRRQRALRAPALAGPDDGGYDLHPASSEQVIPQEPQDAVDRIHGDERSDERDQRDPDAEPTLAAVREKEHEPQDQARVVRVPENLEALLPRGRGARVGEEADDGEEGEAGEPWHRHHELPIAITPRQGAGRPLHERGVGLAALCGALQNAVEALGGQLRENSERRDEVRHGVHDAEPEDHLAAERVDRLVRVQVRGHRGARVDAAVQPLDHRPRHREEEQRCPRDGADACDAGDGEAEAERACGGARGVPRARNGNGDGQHQHGQEHFEAPHAGSPPEATRVPLVVLDRGSGDRRRLADLRDRLDAAGAPCRRQVGQRVAPTGVDRHVAAVATGAAAEPATQRRRDVRRRQAPLLAFHDLRHQSLDGRLGHAPEAEGPGAPPQQGLNRRPVSRQMVLLEVAHGIRPTPVLEYCFAQAFVNDGAIDFRPGVVDICSLEEEAHLCRDDELAILPRGCKLVVATLPGALLLLIFIVFQRLVRVPRRGLLRGERALHEEVRPPHLRAAGEAGPGRGPGAGGPRAGGWPAGL
mmetsp:Transcript_104390/g.319650  ORF Transcript_104390/g.319650 Transcript_104390/m.319650 type:complete len:558 (+) Transcript_104390:1230-2903(+)